MAWIAFVALGPNEAPTLVSCARQAQIGLSASKLLLVTDFPEKWRDVFPGLVVPYLDSDRDPAIRAVEGREITRAVIANGYWVRTLERLFALRKLVHVIPDSEPIIHLESDSLSFVNDEILLELSRRCQKAAVPTVSSEEGCASILFAKDKAILESALDGLSLLLSEQARWVSDMKLLSLGLRAGLLEELPTRPRDGWEIGSNDQGDAPKAKVVFDAAALGLYFFGRDPVHTGGEIQSGYQHAKFPYRISDWRWQLKQRDSNSSVVDLYILSDESEALLFPANLHVHSKEILPSLSHDSPYWVRLVREANGEIPRLPRSGASPYEFERVPLVRKLVAFARLGRVGKNAVVRSVWQSWRKTEQRRSDSYPQW